MKYILTTLAILAASYAHACGGCGGSSYSSGCGGGCGDAIYNGCNSFVGGCGNSGCGTSNSTQPQAIPATPATTNPLPQAIPIEPTKKTTIRVHVPVDAVVVVNGMTTTSKGEDRSYISYINPDYVYTYKITVWVKHDSKWLYEVQTVKLSGDTSTAKLAFALPANTDEKLATTERTNR